jgi:hypothetical protein
MTEKPLRLWIIEQGALVANAPEPHARETHATEPARRENSAANTVTGSVTVAGATGASGSSDLSERDLAILAFERQWWRHAGAKEQGIRAEFGLSAARYYQLLGALLDSPQALAHDPMLVKRLQRMREARAEARARRTLPFS